MARTTPWTATNGLWLGIFAGAVFAVAEMIAAAIMGNPVLMPFRMFSSVLLGRQGLEGPLGPALIVGTLFHFGFSALWGFAYSFIDARLSPELRMSWWAQAAVGALFGLFIWLVDFQVVARAFYPWFLEAPQFLQAVLHALCFGLPLGLVFALRERQRTSRQAGVAPPGQQQAR